MKAAFANATIIRPSVIFGQEDDFINRFAAMQAMPFVPVLRGDAKFQPVFVGDVAQAIAAAALDPKSHAGKTYELGGPEIITMLALNEWIAEATGRTPSFVPVPDAIGGMIACVGGLLPGAPITRDQWLMLQKDNVVAPGSKGLEAFGIAGTPIEAVASAWLVTHQPHGRFATRSKTAA